MGGSDVNCAWHLHQDSQYCCETIKGWAGLSSSCVLLPGTANNKSTIDRSLSSRSCQSVLLSHRSFLLVPFPENIRSQFLKIVITRSLIRSTTRPLTRSSTVLIYYCRNELHLALPEYTSSTTSHINKPQREPATAIAPDRAPTTHSNTQQHPTSTQQLLPKDKKPNQTKP